MWSRSILEKLGHLWFPERYMVFLPSRSADFNSENKYIGLAWPKHTACLVGIGVLNRILSIRREYVGFELENNKCFRVTELLCARDHLIYLLNIYKGRDRVLQAKNTQSHLTSWRLPSLNNSKQPCFGWFGCFPLFLVLVVLFCFNCIASAKKKANCNDQTNYLYFFLFWIHITVITLCISLLSPPTDWATGPLLILSHLLSMCPLG